MWYTCVCWCVCVGCVGVYSRLSDMEYVVLLVSIIFGYKLTLCGRVEKEEQRKEQVVGID